MALDPLKQTAHSVQYPQPAPLAKTEPLIPNLFPSSFQDQSKDAKGVPQLWKGRVVVLAGGSSAGKSTIVNALKSLDKGMVEEGSDLTGANFIYDFMEKNHERFEVTDEDWKHLHSVLVPRKDNWHIHEAVGKEPGTKPDAFDFKRGISKEDQDRAIKTAAALREPVLEFAERTSKMIDHIVMDKILEHAKIGKNAVFDILDIDKVLEHPISKQTNIMTVLVYCPFAKLTERLAERNRKALSGEIDLSEVRAGVFPLLQYSELVRARQLIDQNKDVIDTTTRKSVSDDFDTNFNAGIAILKQTPEGIAELSRMEKESGGLEAKRAREKQILLKNFGFSESDPPNKIIDLVPRKKYDLCIDTSDPSLGKSPVERGNAAALRILMK